MRRFFLLCSFIIFFAAEVKAEIYFEPESISPNLLTPPLSRSGDEYKQEVAYIIKLQKNIDQTELQKAIAENKVSVEMLSQDVLPQVNRADFPLLFKLLDNSAETALAVSENDKKFWNMKRPYVEDSRIKPFVELYLNKSYPSGHTTVAQVLARVLSLLFLEKKEALFKRADEISQHRVLMGMHFPHDLQGGREAALLVLGGLMENKDFLKDFEKAKKEIAQKIKN